MIRNRPLITGGFAAALGMAGLAAYSRHVGRVAEALVPPDGDFAEVEGARLHYVDKGPRGAQDPVIVLIHGLAGQMRNFNYEVADRLAETHRVILVDRPGSGHSLAAPGTHPGLRAQGALIAAFLDRLEIERPLLVGHSMGGAVSLAAALAAPGRIGGLALLAPLTQPQPFGSAAVQEFFRGGAPLRRLVAHTIAVPILQLRSRRAVRRAFMPEHAPDDFAIRGGGILSLRPETIDIAATELVHANPDLSEMAALYQTLDLPSAILFGAQDAVLDPERDGAPTAAAIPSCRYEVIAGGHMIPATQPDRIVRFILDTAARIR